MSLLICLLFLASGLHLLQAENVLLVFPIPTMSHHIVGEELAKALVKKGHHVTIITPFHAKEKPQNYTEVIIEGIVEWKEQTLRKLTNFNTTILDVIQAANEVDGISKLTLESPSVQEFLKSNKRFNAVLIDPLATEALHGFSHFYEAPTIIVNTQGAMPITDRMVGNSQPFAYVPTTFFPFTDEMSFLERTVNTLSSFLMHFVYGYLFLSRQDKVLHKYFPDAPSVWDLSRNVSLVLLNGHYSVVETPRPYLPNMIHVGGFHIQPQTLSKDLRRYLDEAEHGVVYFSLGSNFKTADLPKDKIDIILSTLSKFPQKFLWKFEDDTLDNVPKNVKISKWLPQRAILDHPNVKAFITHGGLLSVTEAVYYGVPFIGVPAFADQPFNIRNAAHRKIAIEFNMNRLNEGHFEAAIKEVLENPVYKENMAVYSSLLRDQPVPPMDLAVYWVEHVLKYKGAAHLQNAGLKLNWIQAYLLDVIAFIVFIAGIVAYINFVIVRSCIRLLRKKFSNKKKLKTN